MRTGDPPTGITRRTLILGSIALGGGIAFGYYQYRRPDANPLRRRPDLDGDGARDDILSITPYLIIDAEGITVIAPRAEMGQGVQATLAAFVAEELDVAWHTVRVIHGPPDKAYYNGELLKDNAPFAYYDNSLSARTVRSALGLAGRLLGMQATGGSCSAKDGFDKMRRAGAAARQVFIAAAARHWAVPADTLRTADGFVINPATGAKRAYQQLAAIAVHIKPPRKVTLKPRREWRYLGASLTKPDMLAKCTGAAQFGIDMRRPGMLYATVIRNPQLGAGMRSFDAAAASNLRGVVDIIALEDGVAVVADNTWRAFQAAKTVRCEWRRADYPATTAAQLQTLRDALITDQPDSRFRDDGDAPSALAIADHVITAHYQAPFLAHAALEPMNATAQYQADTLTIWAGTQVPTVLRDQAAKRFGLDADRVRVHVPLLGGSFGRRTEVDYALQAAAIAKALNGPMVKVTWTREEDTRHDTYRPAAVGHCQGVMGDDGVPHAVRMQIASPSVNASIMRRLGASSPLSDPSIVKGAADQPYDIAHYQVLGYAPELNVPVGLWRSVGASYNGFFHECFLDELAAAGNIDPLIMRLNMTRNFPVAQTVLNALRQFSGWDAPCPKGQARGVAMTLSFGAYVAQVVEVSGAADALRVERVHCVVNPGVALDPGNIEAQMQSGIIFGLTAAMFGEITFADGAVQQSNFHDYPILSLAQTPDIRVKIVQQGDQPQGIGEPGTPPIKPALANAIFALTGQRIREYPLNKWVRFV